MQKCRIPVALNYRSLMPMSGPRPVLHATGCCKNRIADPNAYKSGLGFREIQHMWKPKSIRPDSGILTASKHKLYSSRCVAFGQLHCQKLGSSNQASPYTGRLAKPSQGSKYQPNILTGPKPKGIKVEAFRIDPKSQKGLVYTQ